ncbi:LytTR family DNA-binding domain-containing protein [Undibacterium sp.]|jgi:DNA-binding LytR/AlgR family response regulator|uniref:LytR/AlgR family response regulator transcription factor n=1 Tax=Undibacterium sp. TaxID=1914977 RepID=UPI002BA93305|nr:LytTR family DNA-binding domain-containing protein [Undibacterium sp.]HTD04719.1 LytTR family DNA-binding domain-containing protein [Undibacterium sp.]
MLKCIVAEDEALLRDSLLKLLAEVWPQLEVVAACDDGGAALEAIATHQPDVVFLDIRMPGLSGLEVAAAMAEASPHTQIVFVTAYNQYAIDAFEKGAVDYLLKPIEKERLAATVQRLQTRAASGQRDAAALAALVSQLSAGLPKSAAAAPLVWITASSGTETKLIMVDDIAYFQSDNKYTIVMTAEGEAILRKPIRDLLDVLDPNIFKQIHRATIVNMKAIASIARDNAGKGIVKLKTRPETLSVSQPFMVLFRNM